MLLRHSLFYPNDLVVIDNVGCHPATRYNYVAMPAQYGKGICGMPPFRILSVATHVMYSMQSFISTRKGISVCSLLSRDYDVSYGVALVGEWGTVFLLLIFLRHCGGMNFQRTGMVKVSRVETTGFPGFP